MIPIASYDEMLQLSRKHNAIDYLKREPLLNIIVLKDGSEHRYRTDNGMYHSSTSKAIKETEK